VSIIDDIQIKCTILINQFPLIYFRPQLTYSQLFNIKVLCSLAEKIDPLAPISEFFSSRLFKCCEILCVMWENRNKRKVQCHDLFFCLFLFHLCCLSCMAVFDLHCDLWRRKRGKVLKALLSWTWNNFFDINLFFFLLFLTRFWLMIGYQDFLIGRD